MKNVGSKRFQAWHTVMDRFKYSQGGTDTPVGAHLRDLFGEVWACDLGETLGYDNMPKVEDQYDRFLREYFHHDEYTQQYEAWSDSEAKLFAKLRDVAISFNINDLDMPELSHHPVWLELPDEVRKYYVQLQTSMVAEEIDVSACNAAVRSGKLRQLARGGVLDDTKERKYLHSAKAERLKEIIDEYQGEPVMVFFEFVSDYVSICRTLGYEVPALHGRTTTKQANKHITDWNKGRLDVLALHPRSASYGLNLQDSGSVIVFYSCPWSFEMVNQGIARIWRQGQKNKVLVYYLGITDTVDEEVLRRVQSRESTHNRIMEALL
jgi:SNF2 family DNA or RNA helicase